MEEQLMHMLTACELSPSQAAVKDLAELEYVTWRESVRLFPDSLPTFLA
jgi:hypothetical protein